MSPNERILSRFQRIARVLSVPLGVNSSRPTSSKKRVAKQCSAQIDYQGLEPRLCRFDTPRAAKWRDEKTFQNPYRHVDDAVYASAVICPLTRQVTRRARIPLTPIRTLAVVA